MRVPPVSIGVFGRPTHDLGQKQRYMTRVIAGHVLENRRQYPILRYARVETLRETIQHGHAADPFE
jgi:hypothetical protein